MKRIRLSDEPRYVDRQLYEVAVFWKGKLEGFIAADGKYRYAMHAGEGYTLALAKKLIRGRLARKFIAEKFVLGIIQTTRRSIAVTWRLPT